MVFMVVIGIAIARLHNLFAVVMLTGMFSLTAAVLYVVMDAVDVAFTEAAVGAGISTVLMLGTLALTTSEEKNVLPGSHPWAFVLVLITGIALVYGTLDMPFYGDPTAAIHNHVAPFYLNKSFEHTGLPNVVTSVLASYRGFDTLGEVFVIFTAATAILLTLGRSSFGQSRKAQLTPINLRDPMRNNVILRVISKILIPVILIFALYVQWHGDFGPGGGFQAGTIFGAAFILYALVFDIDTARAVLSPRIIRFGLATGVLLFSLVGVACMFRGGNFLDYSALTNNQLTGQHLGILLVELGVGITVSFAMISIFFTFARQKG
jgi:multicomponent Na+:H+ antiporter subunit B